MRTATRFLCSSDLRRDQGTIEVLCQSKTLTAAEERGDFMGMAAGTQIKPANQFTLVVVFDIDMNEAARKTDALDKPIFGKTAKLQIGCGHEEIFPAPGSSIAPLESQKYQSDIHAHEADDGPRAEIPEEEADREVQCRKNTEKNRDS